jgi:hypothetical protein
VLQRGVEVDVVRDLDGQDARGLVERDAGVGRGLRGGVLNGAPGGRAELDEGVERGGAQGLAERVVGEREVGRDDDVVAVAQRGPRRAVAHADDAPGEARWRHTGHRIFPVASRP